MSWYKEAKSDSADDVKALRASENAKIIFDWFDKYKPMDSDCFVTLDFGRVKLSLGDAEGNYEAHKKSLQEALGKHCFVEVCDECGKPNDMFYLFPRMWEKDSE